MKGKKDVITMKKRISSLFLGFFVVVFISVTAQIAQATLGESAESVASDRLTFSAARHTTQPYNGYTVQDFKTDGNVVREYIAPSGVVFAIAWNGLSHPDLTVLLGTYLEEFQQALRNTSRQNGKRHAQVKSKRVIVEKWGHMRNLQGRAYIPDLIPPGVAINEIK
jgi:hypothetical protein